MDKLSPGVGRGKGNATNVPERLLITEVKQRPLLYDKTVKDYRKVSEINYQSFKSF